MLQRTERGQVPVRQRAMPDRAASLATASGELTRAAWQSPPGMPTPRTRGEPPVDRGLAPARLTSVAARAATRSGRLDVDDDGPGGRID